MRKVRNPLKGLFTVHSKGRDYHYAWRNGPRIEAEYGTPEFYAEFLQARSPLANQNKQRFAAWVTEYRMSDKWKNLAPKTKAQWAPLLDSVQEHFGTLPVRVFNQPTIRRDIKHWRDKWKATPRMADTAKLVLSRVCALMVEDGVLALNPCSGIANLYSANRSDIIWTVADMAAMESVASPEITRAMKLAAFSGLRQGDLLKLTWAQVGELAIEIKTGKSRYRTKAVIPLYPALRAVLAAIPKRGPIVLTNVSGRPWRSGFQRSWNDTKIRAGLKDSGLHFHDLRGTAATNFYRAGFTIQEIAEAMAWKGKTGAIEALINTYVRRGELMADRIRKMERLENENSKTDSKTDVRKSV